ncbi:MAG: M23 family metallopeptidase [Deltaproteobacteria bacterium]|nr:M23 family metallopeptidase [Deltaproteobacteria bacterium]
MEKIKPSLTSVFFILLALSLILSCFKPQMQKTQTMGVYHLVKKNETVQMIARAYGVPLKDLVETNNISDVNSVKDGSVVFIPSANQVIDVRTDVKTKDTAADVKAKKYSYDNGKDFAKNKKVKEVTPVKEAPVAVYKKEASPVMQSPTRQQPQVAVLEKPAPAKTISGEKFPDEKIETSSKVKKQELGIKIDKNRFIWPVRGSVKTNFGIQPNKTYHNWIKIVYTAGAKVKAAAFGTVIFSSKLKNYGETIIIRHKEKFATVYTHLKKRYVRTDQNVKKGETIAVVGETDDAGEAYINFEIRLQGKARDPLLFLP